MNSSSSVQRGRKRESISTTRNKLIELYTVLALLWLAPCVKAQEVQIGYIIAVKGKWFLSSGSRSRQSLGNGQGVPAGGVVSIQSPSPDDYIKIALSNGKIISGQCDGKNGECHQPIVLPRTVQRQASVWDSIMKQAMNLFRRDPGKYSVHMVRSFNGKPQEAVLQTQHGQVDLAPAFREMGRGTYHVYLQRKLHSGNPADGEPGEPLTIKWDPANASAMPIANLETGIYELVLLKRRGEEYEPTLINAWVLVSNPAKYAQTASSFREATQLTAAWRGEVDETAVRSFLRAYLEHLAMQPAKEAK